MMEEMNNQQTEQDKQEPVNNLGHWSDGTPVQSGQDALMFQMSPTGRKPWHW
jgi:hypothetical protein